MNPPRDDGMQWRRNFPSSVVLFLISLPIAMGVAIASDVPPARGLVTAAIGGLVVGNLTGTRLQVSGPSAGMAVMVLEVVRQHGLESLAVIVPLMGIVQMIAGKLALGQVFRAVSPAVIDGMVAGIGVLLFGAQFHVMVDDAPKGTGLDNLLSIPSAVHKGLFPISDTSMHHWAALVGTLTLVVLVGMRTFARGRLKKIPPPLAAVTVATLAVWAADLGVRRVEMPRSFMSAFSFPHAGLLNQLAKPEILLAALAFAFVATAETLLCATAMDGMHDGPRADYDRELFAQGVGNTLCGLVGAPPLAGVITRSTANHQAGATSPASPIMMGGWVLLVLVLFPTALQIIPRASLAGLLVYVGFRLVKTRPLKELRWYGRSELVIFATTLTVIVTVSLLHGIVLGVLLAVGKLIYSRGARFHRLELEVQDEPDALRTHLHLRGAASFLRLPRLAEALEGLPIDREVHLHVEDLEYIDHACLDLLEKWELARTRSHSPVRVLWSHLHHQYHAGNRLDATPEEHARLPSEDVRLLDFLSPDAILINSRFLSKEHALTVLAEHLASLSPVKDAARRILHFALHHEREVTTYVGSGLMIPHARTSGEGPLRGALALSREGWQWGSKHDRLHCILLLQTPDSEAGRHLAIVAGFARVFTRQPELRRRLLASTTPEEAYEILTGPDAESVNTVVERRISTPPPGNEATP